jgi:hypothetical protein
MRKFFILLYVIAVFYTNNGLAQSDSIRSYVTYLKGQNQSAKDYILDLFNNYDIVIICERLHGEMTQYDLLADIISDKRFVEKVGNLFTEVGVSTLNPSLNTFLHTKNLPPEMVENRIINFQRNCSFWPIWDNKNYSFFLHTLYSVNNSLPAEDAINVYPSDLPFTWAGADSLTMLKLKTMLAGRDSIIASQIIAGFNKIKISNEKRKKALVVMNYRHSFNQEFFVSGHSLKNAGYFLFKQYGNRVANVLLNTVGTTSDKFSLLQDGKWDAAFKLVDKEDIGFGFGNSPFGKDSFDLWPYQNNFTYQHVFTGLVFFRPIEKHHITEGYPGLIDSSFRTELMNRMDLICILGGEFKKMANLKKVLEGNNTFLNAEDDKKYYQIDTLTYKRDSWLK